jgi:transposase-like protein
MRIELKVGYLWRAVDGEGEVLEALVAAKRDKAAAPCFSLVGKMPRDNRLTWPPRVPACNHPARDVALRSLHPQLSGCSPESFAATAMGRPTNGASARWP